MAPLGAEALAELVRDWVGSSASVAALPARIGERCGGNPLFAEEIALSLIETGRFNGRRGAYELTTVDAIEVPATVQALLAARIDRLGKREKQVLYTAVSANGASVNGAGVVIIELLQPRPRFLPIRQAGEALVEVANFGG